MGLRNWIKKYTGIKLKNFKKNTPNIRDMVKKNNFLSFGDSHILTKLIGKNTYINGNSYIGKNVKIGNYCSISSNVKIGLTSHPTSWLSSHPFQYDENWKEIKKDLNFKQTHRVIIGNDVWVGDSAIIIGNVEIGNGLLLGRDRLLLNLSQIMLLL